MHALMCFFTVLIIFLIFYKIGWMGAGDVKLGCVLGFVFGFGNFLWIWVISIIILINYLFVIKIICRSKYKDIGLRLMGNYHVRRYIPYGTFLSISSMLLILKSEMVL